MFYGDEENIALRQEALRKAALDIRYSAEVDGVEYSFSRKMLFNSKVSMVLPEQFEEMSQEQARFKYPSEFRPQVILTDGAPTNFTFSYLEHEVISNESIVEMQKNLRMSSKRMHPANVFEDVQQVDTGDLIVPWYASRATAFDADIYLVQFLATIDSKLLMGGFSCIYGKHENWTVLLPQCFATIRDETIDTREG